MSCLKAEKSPWFSWKLNFTVWRQVAWKLWRDSIMQLRWLYIEGTCHKHSLTVPAFQLHGTKGLQGLQHILHALPWVSPLWLPPSHLETEVAFVGAKQDNPVLSLLWSQPGKRWGSWVHELSSHYPLCGKLQGCVNPSPALLSLACGRTGLRVQPPAQNTHSPPRDKHAVCTPRMQWWEPQQCMKFNVRIVLWQWSRKLAPDDCAGCNRVNETEKAATALLSASQQKIQMERKRKRPKFGTRPWLYSIESSC